jgi:hypothetical protein
MAKRKKWACQYTVTHMGRPVSRHRTAKAAKASAKRFVSKYLRPTSARPHVAERFPVRIGQVCTKPGSRGREGVGRVVWECNARNNRVSCKAIARKAGRRPRKRRR